MNYVLGKTLERLYQTAKRATRDMTLILSESLKPLFGIDGDFIQVAYPLGKGEVQILIHELNFQKGLENQAPNK